MDPSTVLRVSGFDGDREQRKSSLHMETDLEGMWQPPSEVPLVLRVSVLGYEIPLRRDSTWGAGPALE